MAEVAYSYSRNINRKLGQKRNHIKRVLLLGFF